jgi:hypothetical protein
MGEFLVAGQQDGWSWHNEKTLKKWLQKISEF